eukprot:CAMPEP_0178828860 /NCGR_PEP_ID=MMETSP0746-20121128/8060_1 /TAXON_ID=913974 /ORGANISM="Nitzschia punctata, Strain CCMP561" /LENGTH=222 /DNA_ID=CAMNT_0020490879 /DNA_START=1 /DNA_END=666 /DNA_ORIENTATION=+
MHQRKRHKPSSDPDQNKMSSPSRQELELDYATTSATSSRSSNLSDKEGIKHFPSLSPICITWTNASLYVLSGCSQPLIMALLKEAGVADASCQAYMLFYYLFPASFVLPVILNNDWPRRSTILKACGIATWDILSTSMNYTGASLAGPTIFAIIYSSVTIWTAVFSQIFLGRIMSFWQWLAVLVVFAGLTLTATDSLTLGKDVAKGSFLVMIGSAMHALTYV